MAATSIAFRSTKFLGSSIFRAASSSSRSFISPKSKLSVPNLSSTSSSRFNASPLRQSRIEGSVPRFLRRELSTLLPLHSVVAAACLVSKLPSDVTSYEGRFVNYVSPI
ncbi:unnamed protein product [Cochlearia groenlandica]